MVFARRRLRSIDIRIAVRGPPHTWSLQTPVTHGRLPYKRGCCSREMRV